MVRPSDLHPEDRANLTAKHLPRPDASAYVPAPPLSQSRIALLTTAGLHVRGDRVFDNESALGRLLRDLAARGSKSDDVTMRFFANDSLVPRRFR